MFFFKKLITPLFFPVPLTLLILVVGVILLWHNRRPKLARALVSVGVLLLILCGYGIGTDRALVALEREYPPLALETISDPALKWIVVLGGGTSSDQSLPITSRLSEGSLTRLIEGIRLHRQLPGSKLLLSGGSAFGSGKDAESMAALAEALGLSPTALVLEAESKDTEEQAQIIRGIVGDEKFIMVTSASHMPRAMRLFARQGMHPLPAPTHYLIHHNQGVGPGDFYPSTGGLSRSGAAIYEYLGRAWAKLRGRI